MKQLAHFSLLVFFFLILSGCPDPKAGMIIGADTPQWSPDGTKIVFMGIVYLTRDEDICVINPDGTGLQNLTNETGMDHNPVFRPGTNEIIWDSYHPAESDHIVEIMNLDGSNRRVFTNETWAYAAGAHWSPNGTKILFERYFNSNYEIFIVDSDGISNILNLTNDPGFDSQPSWSTNGTKVVFTSNRFGDWEIFSMNPDGSLTDRLTTTSGIDNYPMWLSTDGSKIVFESERNGVNSPEIYVMDSDGQNQTRLTFTGYNKYPKWSPDGTKILFFSWRNNQYEYWTMDPDGSNQTFLVKYSNGGNGGSGQWSPDSSKVLFVSDEQIHGPLGIINADGSNLRYLYTF
jgi:Tol biopolymer transport system component